ncbi:uncharacterized protein [Oscarella lobularis]|uniref:uncharacterized protein n=1 Tax=Oscarella lobularis TaxID=121494 RepID=UPI003313EC2E
MWLLLLLLSLSAAMTSAKSLVCYECRRTNQNDSIAACDITGGASAIECDEGDVCYTNKGTGRGCKSRPLDYGGGVALVNNDTTIICDTDVCNDAPLNSLTCYSCAQSLRDDCDVTPTNQDPRTGPRVSKTSCPFGHYCRLSYTIGLGGQFISIHRDCLASVDVVACQSTVSDCEEGPFGGLCSVCCSSDECNDLAAVTAPISCYHCAQTGPDAESDCAVTPVNINASRVIRRACARSTDVCLSRKAVNSSGAVLSFVRTCLDMDLCTSKDECANGGICSSCCNANGSVDMWPQLAMDMWPQLAVDMWPQLAVDMFVTFVSHSYSFFCCYEYSA